MTTGAADAAPVWNPLQSYRVSEETWSGFVQANLSAARWTGNIGVRAIHTDQSSKGFSANGSTLTAVSDGDKYWEFAPNLNLNFKADLSDQVIDSFIDQFLDDAIAGNGLDYVGGEDYGLVCLAKRGSVNEEQRSAVEAWLKGRDELQGFEVSPLLDVWYPGNPINQA